MPNAAAIETWKKKLAMLQKQEALAVLADEKFRLVEQIEEAKSKIEELQKELPPLPTTRSSKRSVTETVQITSGSGITLLGILTAVAEMTGQLKSIYENLGSLPPPIIWGASGLALLFGISLFTKGFARRSRLLQPEAFDIDPDNPDHLCGRTNEVSQLQQDISNHALVFLEGESGSGKSALVRSGLIPAMEAQSPAIIFHLYLNSYGTDWALGPARQLAAAIWQRSSADERTNFIGEKELATSWPQALARIARKSGTRPLIIFDQFDDYQAQHRDRFLKKGKWTAPAKLASQNAFWQEVRTGLDEKNFHCLIVTRQDTVDGLESVRFVDPELFYLYRLEQTYMRRLLDQLTVSSSGSAVVSDPEAGWNALKGRLIEDLALEGRILPVQARMAVKGLTRLPSLTLASYVRAGGLRGLEVDYLEDAMRIVTTRTNLFPKQVLTLLRELVDPAIETPKTRSMPESSLIAKLAQPSGTVSKALNTLEQLGIVRVRLNAETAVSEWSLYHDYFARAVLLTESRADRWQQFLQSKSDSFSKATGWLTRWRSLLSPWESIRILGSALRGKVRLAPHGPYLLAGSLRTLPWLALLTIGLWGGNWYLDQQALSEAKVIRSAIDATRYSIAPEGYELEKLRTLASASWRIKKQFIHNLLESPMDSDQLNNRIDYIAHAILSLDPHFEKRDDFLSLLDTDTKSGNPQDSATRGLLMAKIIRSNTDRYRGFSASASEMLVTALSYPPGLNNVTYLAENLIALAPNLSPEQAYLLVDKLVVTPVPTSYAHYWQFKSTALAALTKKLTSIQANILADKLVTFINPSSEYDLLDIQAKALVALAQLLTPDQANNLAIKLVTFINSTSESGLLDIQAKALATLAQLLTSDQASSLADKLLNSTIDPDNAYKLDYLSKSLAALVQKSTANQRASFAENLAIAITKAPNYQLPLLAFALVSIDQKLPSNLTASLADKLMPALLETTIDRDLATLAQGLSMLTHYLTPDQITQITGKLMTAMSNKSNLYDLNSLSKGLAAFTQNLTPEQLIQTIENLISSVHDYYPNDINESDILDSQIETLKKLTQILTSEQAIAEIEKIQSLHDTDRPYSPVFIDKILALLTQHLTSDQANLLANKMVDTVQIDTSYTYVLDFQIQTLAAQLPKLSSAQLASIAEKIVIILTKTNISYREDSLVKTLLSITQKLTPEQVAPLAKKLAENINSNTREFTSPPDLQAQEPALLAPEAPSKTASSLADSLAKAMDALTNDYRSELIHILAAFSEKIAAEPAPQLAEKLVKAMSISDRTDQVISLANGLAELKSVKQCLNPQIPYLVLEMLNKPQIIMPLEDAYRYRGYSDTGLLKTRVSDVLLDYLGRVMRQEPFPDMDSLCAWAQQNRPDLDLENPLGTLHSSGLDQF